MNIIEGEFGKPRVVKPKKKFLKEKDKRYYCKLEGNYVISDHSYEIDFEREKIICTTCKLDFSVWHVLKDLCREESRWNYERDGYQKTLEKLQEKSRTKCQHCGKLTRVNI